MIKTQITIGRSVQVYNVGQPESWVKATISATLSENDNVADAVDELFNDINAIHEKYSKGNVDTFSYPAQKKPAMMKPDEKIRDQHSRARKEKNMALVHSLELIYDFNIG